MIKKDVIIRAYEALDTNNGSINVINQINELAYQLHPADYLKSFELAKKSLKLARKRHYLKGEAEAFHLLGISFYHVENYLIADQYQNRCIEIAKKIKNSELLARAYNAKGLAAYHLERYENAHEYFQKSLNYLNKISQNHSYKGAVMHNIATLYDDEEKSKMALKFFDLAIAFNLKNHNGLWLGQNYYEKAIAYRHLSNFKAAIQNSKTSVHYANKVNDDKMIVQNLILQGSIAIDFGELYKAQSLLDSANQLVSKNHFSKLRLATLKSLSQLAEKRNDFKKSLGFEREYNRLYDSLYNVNRFKQLDEFRAYFDTEQKQKENELLKKLNLNQKIQLENRNYFILAIFLLLSLSIYLAYLIYINNKKIRKSNQVLIHQNEEISTQKLELEELNQLKNKFFSIISHDLRGPLSSLSAMLKLYEDGHMNEEELKIFMRELDYNFVNTSSLVDNLLVWGKSQMQGEVLSKKRINLCQMIDDAISLIKVQHKKKRLKIYNHAEFCYAYADAETMSVVIRNLLNNAAKFTPEGGEITVSSKKEEMNIVVCIKDNGVGLNEEQKNEILKRSFHTSVGTNKEKGTGIGLMICQEFIEKNGGRFWLESKKGEGSSFYFSLPLKN
ncbi:MAG: tetratricopeptide repeat-containing sensor histidine kinase [Sphingobacteriales bacterium]|nr:tetratricopeptide repeat-containing sensor histidine kinase [Sphingobacteriales bacterium]